MTAEEERSYLEILYNVSRELASSLDLHEVLTRVLMLVSSNLGVERASLFVLDAEGKPIDAVVLYQGEITSNDSSYISDLLQSGLAGWVMRHKAAALVTDTHQDERWMPRTYEGKVDSAPKSAICVPVMMQDEIHGLLTVVHPQVNYFNAAHLQLQQAIADMAGIAIRNAQLFSDLQKNRDLYQGLFEGIADPVFVTDSDGLIIEFNKLAREVSGYTRKELLKTNMTDLDVRGVKTLASLMNDKRALSIKQYESSLRKKDGQEVPVEVRVSWNRTHEYEFIQWIFRDISERQKLEALRDSMTAMIYHDLRSPLANVISSLELINESLTLESDPQIWQLVQIANRSSSIMQRLISSLLDIRRLQSGQEIIRKSDVNLDALVDEAIEIVRPLFESKQINVERITTVEPPKLELDEDMIRRVIINLLENAIKFSPLNTEVTVGIKPGRDEVIVFIEDQGPGIPETYRERIFEKYFRLDTEGKSRGLGLGLSFCQLAVQAHGGKIWVESGKPIGSRFLFSLPFPVDQASSVKG
jgi:PAS domain S-box-containing protein